MKKMTALTLTTLLATSPATWAAATSIGPYQQTQGFYIGAQWLPGQEALGNGSSGIEFYPGAAGFNIGFQFNPHLALEASIQSLYEHTNWNFGYGIKGSESDDIMFPALAVKGILPIGNRITFYAKAGAAIAIVSVKATGVFANSTANVQSTGSEFAPMLGAGMGIYLTHHFETSIDQTFYYLTKDKTVYGMTGIGLTYHF